MQKTTLEYLLSCYRWHHQSISQVWPLVSGPSSGLAPPRTRPHLYRRKDRRSRSWLWYPGPCLHHLQLWQHLLVPVPAGETHECGTSREHKHGEYHLINLYPYLQGIPEKLVQYLLIFNINIVPIICEHPVQGHISSLVTQQCSCAELSCAPASFNQTKHNSKS